MGRFSNKGTMLSQDEPWSASASPRDDARALADQSRSRRCRAATAEAAVRFSTPSLA